MRMLDLVQQCLGGILFLAVLHAGALFGDIYYVNWTNPTAQPGYTNGWASAASNIQDAVMWAGTGDVVLVAPGIYESWCAKRRQDRAVPETSRSSAGDNDV